MSSTPFDATIDLALRPSLRALTILFWLHAGVLVLAVLSMPQGPVTMGLAALVAVSWIWTRRHYVFGFGPRALTRLTWHASGGWTVHDTAGHYDVQLEGNSVVHDLLLLLNFRLENGSRRSRAILGDEVDPDLIRRLRARLANTH
jgi:toxin CptA